VIAEGDTRTLSLHHMHTGEDIVITYRRNGHYDDAALEKLNWFVRDWRREEKIKMDPRLFDLIWEVYREVGGKEPIQIVCGYRSPETNAMLRRRSHGVAQFSQHMLGHAMDFFIPGVPLEEIRYAGLRLQRGGVGFYPTSGSPFVHLDTGHVRHWPRMTREQLVRVFPDGKTVHIPSDGHPLKGYALALADIEKRGNSPSSISLDAAHSNGAISDADLKAAGASPKKFLAKLFGIKEEEDEDAEATGSAGSSTSPKVAALQGQVAAAAVPLPSQAAVPKPTQRPTRTGQFALASAAQASVALPPASRSAADAITLRGNWRGDTVAVAAARASSGVMTPDDGTMRPPRAIEVADAAPDSSPLASWPDANGHDNSSTELLGYAPASKSEPVAARATPMGALRKPAPARMISAAPSQPQMLPGQHIDNPWLRGLVISPSIWRSMSVAVLGPPDYRQLTPFLGKPVAILTMAFGENPHDGMTFDCFGGAAVVFMPTLKTDTQISRLD